MSDTAWQILEQGIAGAFVGGLCALGILAGKLVEWWQARR